MKEMTRLGINRANITHTPNINCNGERERENLYYNKLVSEFLIKAHPNTNCEI